MLTAGSSRDTLRAIRLALPSHAAIRESLRAVSTEIMSQRHPQ